MSHEQIVQTLHANNMPFTLHRHAPLRTVQDYLGQFTLEQMLKTVAFRVKDGPWVLVALRGADQFRPHPHIAVGDNQALLLYYLNSGGAQDVYGQRIQADGTLLDGTLGFAVTTAPNRQFLPAGAWDGTQYVVAYEDYRNFAPLNNAVSDIYASRVTSGGTVLDPGGFPVANRFAPEISPAVAGLPGSVIIGFSNFIEIAPYAAYRLTLEHIQTGQVPTPAPT